MPTHPPIHSSDEVIQGNRSGRHCALTRLTKSVGNHTHSTYTDVPPNPRAPDHLAGPLTHQPHPLNHLQSESCDEKWSFARYLTDFKRTCVQTPIFAQFLRFFAFYYTLSTCAGRDLSHCRTLTDASLVAVAGTNPFSGDSHPRFRNP